MIFATNFLQRFENTWLTIPLQQRAMQLLLLLLLLTLLARDVHGIEIIYTGEKLHATPYKTVATPVKMTRLYSSNTHILMLGEDKKLYGMGKNAVGQRL